MAQFFLNPYGEGKGQYIETDGISDSEELSNLVAKAARKGRFEEFSVEFIDGTDEEADLWNAIRQDGYGGLELFVRAMNEVDEYELAGVYVAILNHGITDLDEAIQYAENGGVREGTLEDLAHEFVDEGIIDNKAYIDYDAIERDLKLEGAFEEFEDEHGTIVIGEEEISSYIDELVDSNPKYYFENYCDYDAIERDLGYDYEEFEFGGKTYTICTAQ